MNKFLVAVFFNIILLSYFSNIDVYSFSLNSDEKTSIPQGKEDMKFKQQVTHSIFRIGVMTPKYYLENYEPFFDPIAIGWNYDYRRNSLLYEALVHYDPQSEELSPALAKQWVVSKDGKHWTFYLREDVIFHDGSQFNASIVKYNYDRLIDPNHPAYVPPAPYISLHTIPFDTIEVQSEFQITIHLKESFAAFIHECSSIQIATPTSFNESKIVSPIGTGPYVLTSTFFNSTFQNCTFTRFPYYYQGLAPFEQLHYYSQEDFTDEINNHQIDIVFLHDTLYDVLKTDTYWIFNISKEITDFEMIYINHQDSYLSDPNVRLAINYAINKQDYIARMNWTEFSQPMTNLIPPGVSLSKSSEIGYPYNVTLANEILDQAGYPRGKDNYRFLIGLTGSENRHPEIIREYLDAVGIWTPPIEYPDDWAALWREGNYGLLLFGSTVFNDPDLCRLYLHPTGPFNTGGFKNADIDAQIARGYRTPIRQEREYYYNQLQPLIHETAPYIYLTYKRNIYAIAHHLETFILINKVKQIYFNYSHTSSQPLSILKYQIAQLDEEIPNEYERISSSHILYNNVEITDYPLYFPRADCVIASLQQKPLLVNVTMSHKLNTILPSQKESGKFIQIDSENEHDPFRLRCYYDVEEVQGKSHEQLMLFRYNTKERKWTELEILASNATFRYLEVELMGGTNLIRFNEPFLLKTFRLVPFFVIAIGGLVVSALSIVIYNFKKTKYIRGRILK